MTPDDPRPDDHLVLYDDRCDLCRGAVEFVRRRDRSGRWSFSPLTGAQSEADGSPAEAPSVVPGPPGSDPAAHDPKNLDPQTLHLFDDHGHHERSGAVLRLAAGLPAPWSWLRFLRVLPRRWRDAAYDLIARNRGRWPLSRRRGRR